MKVASFLVNGNNEDMTRNEGFTLVEMIVVIALIGILASTALAIIDPIGQLQKSHDARSKIDLESIQHALELYYQDNGHYPVSSANFQITSGTASIPWGSAWQPYIAILPKDPVLANTYVYYSPAAANGQTYYLYANLQRGGKDPQACNKGNACSSIGSSAGFPSSNACGGICNYGVSSSNVSP